MKKLIILFIAISLVSCKARKVATEISKSTDKTKTEQESRVVANSNVVVKDQSKTVATVSDSSKKVEDENVIIKGDNITYNKNTGEVNAKGNASAHLKKHTNTANNINKSLERSHDVNINASSKSDSAGKKKEDRDKSDSKKTKSVEAKPSYAWIGILIMILAMLAAIAWIWKNRK